MNCNQNDNTVQELKYDFHQMSEKIDQIKRRLGVKSDNKLSDELQIGRSLRSYINPDSKVKRNIGTLAIKLRLRYGISVEWFLFDNGPMMVDEIERRDNNREEHAELVSKFHKLLRIIDKMPDDELSDGVDS